MRKMQLSVVGVMSGNVIGGDFKRKRRIILVRYG